MARRVRQEVSGVLLIAGGLYLGLCLFSYDRWDPSLFTYSTSGVKNMGGIVGAYVSDAVMSLFGFPSYAAALFMVGFGVISLLSREIQRLHIAGSVLFLFSASVLSGLSAVSFGLELEAGGLIGSKAGGLLTGGLSAPGAYIVSLAAFFSSLIMLSPVSLIQALARRRGRAEPALPLPVTELPSLPSEPLADVGLPPQTEPEAEPPPAIKPPAFEIHPAELKVRGDSKASSYKFPPLSLLSLYESVTRPLKEDTASGSALLEKKLADYGVQGRVIHVHTGPVITLYEFEPAPGTKIMRIIALAEDLALALRAQSVRVSPVHGKAAIGIEIPNRHRETVALREIIASEGFKKSQSKLTLAFGKDIFGSPVVADLTRMPHLLVAGATGAGKSVFLNSMVTSILYKASPDEVKMLMIDPKLLELSAYDGIPHLIAPVVTAPKEAAEMLRAMVFEMERRYRLIAEKGARSIENYNAAASDGEERLPYIVVFIDELADLMFASTSSHVEDSIARLAQMARASGIHLMLATQRPSVDVITGLIKANFPARVAFQVTSKIDSRTIIDAQGAEQLIGRGDMLFMLPGLRIVRIHGALITESEVKAVTDFVRGQGAPDYGLLPESEAEPKGGSGERDELYYRALEFAESAGEVSISALQRRLKVGFNRAARIMELMEEDGLVGPPKGAGKPRDFRKH